MDKRDFDFSFDFEKEYGIDPSEFSDTGDDLDIDLNDPIFQESPAESAPQEPQEVAPDSDPLDDLDLSDLGLDDEDGEDMDFVDDEPVEDDPEPEDEDPEAYDPEDGPSYDTEPDYDDDPDFEPEPEPEPVRELTPEERREQRRLQRQKEKDFKENKLPRYIAAGAAALILFFIAGSIIRGTIRKQRDLDNQQQANASSQSAAQLQEEEAQRLLEEAASLAAGYDYAAAIDKLDSFSGEITTYPEMVNKRAEYVSAGSQLTAWSDPAKIPNLSFHMLIADPSRAFTNASLGKKYNQNFVTIDEFEKILQQLYDNGFVLVSLKDMFTETTGTDGVTTYAANTIYLPSGKKPVMITETLVNYLIYMIDSDDDGEADKGGAGFASRLVVDSNGDIKAELVTSTGDTSVGNYDLVPILNDFIKSHPDFSYRGARAMLAVCGYQGIFGYRINESVVKDKGQSYYDEQVAGAKKVVEALREEGYDFACYSYANISYGSITNASQIKDDLTSWNNEIVPILGQVDTLIYAQTSDIEAYTGSKYNVLYSSGFRYFINNSSAPYAEIGNGYVKQSRLMVTGSNMAYYSHYFSDYFNATAVMNSSRGNVPS